MVDFGTDRPITNTKYWIEFSTFYTAKCFKVFEFCEEELEILPPFARYVLRVSNFGKCMRKHLETRTNFLKI